MQEEITARYWYIWGQSDGSTNKSPWRQPDDLSSIPGTHTVEGENWPPYLHKYACFDTCMCAAPQTWMVKRETRREHLKTWYSDTFRCVEQMNIYLQKSGEIKPLKLLPLWKAFWESVSKWKGRGERVFIGWDRKRGKKEHVKQRAHSGFANVNRQTQED